MPVSINDQRLFAFPQAPSGIRECRVDVFRFKVRIGIENPLTRVSRGKQAESCADRHNPRMQGLPPITVELSVILLMYISLPKRTSIACYAK